MPPAGLSGLDIGYDSRQRRAAENLNYRKMPIADMIVEIRSVTQGVGTFRTEFDHLQEPVRLGIFGRRAGKEDTTRPKQSVHMTVERREFVALQELTKARAHHEIERSADLLHRRNGDAPLRLLLRQRSQIDAEVSADDLVTPFGVDKIRGWRLERPGGAPPGLRRGPGAFAGVEPGGAGLAGGTRCPPPGEGPPGSLRERR